MITKTVGRRNAKPLKCDLKVMEQMARGSLIHVKWNAATAEDDFTLNDEEVRKDVVKALLFHFWVKEVSRGQFKLTSRGRTALEQSERCRPIVEPGAVQEARV